RGRDQKGWTLVELMAGLVVSSIVTSMVVPAFKDVVDRSRLAVSANQLLTDLTMARQKGVMSGLPTTFCAGDPARGCTGNWSARTWIVFVDRDRDGRLGANDVVLSRADLASETSLTIAGNGPFGSAVVFDPIGTSIVQRCFRGRNAALVRAR